MWCNGTNYSSFAPGGPTRLTPAPAATSSGNHPTLGNYDEITTTWAPEDGSSNNSHRPTYSNVDSRGLQGGPQAGLCTVATAVRYYPAFEAFTFTASFAPQGVPRVNATALLDQTPVGGANIDWDVPLATAFPIWSDAYIPPTVVPTTTTPPAPRSHEDTTTPAPTASPPSPTLRYVSYSGNSLGDNFRSGTLDQWVGGVEGGPLLVFAQPHDISSNTHDSNSHTNTTNGTGMTTDHPASIVLSPLTHPKSVITSHRGGRIAVGVQGYVEELPPSFSHEAVLVGRVGISAAQMAWGTTVRAHANTTRLTLDTDLYNRKLHYMTDNGAYYCYCNRWRDNKNAQGGHYGALCMATTRSLLPSSNHRSNPV